MAVTTRLPLVNHVVRVINNWNIQIRFSKKKETSKYKYKIFFRYILSHLSRKPQIDSHILSLFSFTASCSFVCEVDEKVERESVTIGKLKKRKKGKPKKQNT